MGAAMAGIPYVPLNYRLSKEQLLPLFERISPAYLITGKRDDNYDFEDWIVEESNDFLHKCLKAEHSDYFKDVDPNEVAVQLFTSGTTGTPKAALLRHEHLVSYILGSVEFMGAMEEEAALVSVPPYRGHLGRNEQYLCLPTGSSATNFNASEWLKLCQDHSVTSAFLVPTMLTRIIEELNENQTRSLCSPSLMAAGKCLCRLSRKP